MNRKKKIRIKNKNRLIISTAILLGIATGLIYIGFAYASEKETEQLGHDDIATESAIQTVQEDVQVVEQVKPSRSNDIDNKPPMYNISLLLEYQQYIWKLCEENQISYEMLLCIGFKESRFDVNAINYNSDGSFDCGLFQLNSNTMYALAKDLEIENFDPYNPYHNIKCAVYYLTTMRNNFAEIYSEEYTFGAICLGFHKGGNKVMNMMKYNGADIVYQYDYVQDIENYKAQLEQYGTITE